MYCLKLGVLKSFAKFTKIHLCQRLWHRSFSVNFVKFLRTFLFCSVSLPFDFLLSISFRLMCLLALENILWISWKLKTCVLSPLTPFFKRTWIWRFTLEIFWWVVGVLWRTIWSLLLLWMYSKVSRNSILCF